MAMTFADVFWTWYRVTGTWPLSRTDVDNQIRGFASIEDLEARLRETSSRGIAGGIPPWAMSMIAEELGANAYYLNVPELAPIILQAAAESWTPDKLQARIESTSYWANTTQRQRSWQLMSQAEREQVVSQWSIQVMEILRDLYGPEHVSQQGWTPGHEKVRGWAAQLGSGVQLVEVFTYAHRAAAEAMDGTPAFNARMEDFRQAGAADVAIDEIRGELQETWQEWIGDHLTAPELSAWAENIYANRQSRQDFEDYVKGVAQELYPNKGPNVAYRTWVQAPKALIGQTLELGFVNDSDPLLRSYIAGEIPSLNDLQLRAWRDPRYDRTSQARTEAQNLGYGIREAMGF